jgi:hypothetical protein
MLPTVLDDLADSVNYLGPSVHVVLDSRGSYYVRPRTGDHKTALTRYDAQGRYAGTIQESPYRRTLGAAVGPADSIYLFGIGGVSVVSPEGRVVRNIPVGGGQIFSIAFDDEGRLGVASELPTPDDAGHPVHIVHPNGGVVRSFGGSEKNRSDRSSQGTMLASAPSGGFWVGPVHLGHTSLSYRMELWRTDGTLVETVVRQAPWLRLPKPVGGFSPPDPALLGIWQDDDGILWTLLHVPGPTYNRGLAHTSEGKTGLADPAGMNLIFDSVVEAIDLESGRVLARQRLPEGVLGLGADGGILSGMAPDAGGAPRVTLWRLSLSRR